MLTIKVSSKGQIAIPKLVRERLGLTEGSQLALEIKENNLILHKVSSPSWKKWRGSLRGTNALQEYEQEHHQEVQQDEENS